MSTINFDHHAQFFTATILEWKSLLRGDDYKIVPEIFVGNNTNKGGEYVL